MTSLRLTLVAAALSPLLAVSLATAEEPYLEFLDGLRERGYTDFALDYIDSLETASGVPSEIKLRIPFERGMTLLQEAQTQKNRERQKEQFDEATASLADFVSKAPKGHPLLPEANTQRGRVWLGRAQVEIWEASTPANEGAEGPFRERAREYVEKARKIFQQAHDQYEAKVKSYPTFIPQEEQELREERKKAEQRFIQAQIDLATCTYERAQTFKEDSDLRKKTLNEAADEFRQIHERYRTYFSGLYARLYQGKCFEEQDDVRKALGLYNEVLEHPGSKKNAALNRLQDTARWFRLICLNHPDRKDFQLVVDEAKAWMSENDSRRRTKAGLGIAYEHARALESIADDRTTEAKIKDNSLKQALAIARQINRYPGQLKGVSASMIQRLMVKLDRDPGDPRDFDTAYGLGNSFLDDVAIKKAEYETAIAGGDKKKIAEAKTAMEAVASEAARMFQIALRLSDSLTDPDMVKLARYRLAYSYYLADRPLETAVLGSFIARSYRDDDKQVAQDAAYLALAGLDREFFASPKGKRDYELGLVIEFANQIIADFPNSGRASDARYAVARLYRAEGDFLNAAKWFSQVPDTASQYPAMQIDAGQAYWNVYLTEVSARETRTSTPEDLQNYRKLAEQHLQRGINRTEAKLGPKAKTPDPLALAKLSLSQIRNADGVYKTADGKTGAIELLTAGPHAVTKAVAVKEGEKRPTKTGAVKGSTIASLAYQQLLRAYIGVRDLAKARETREALENVAGKDDAAALTRVYIDFGRELQTELSQLKASGETERLEGVRAAFEEFLDDLFNREDGQTFNSLLWIAETYGGLGEGSAEKPAIAKGYFDKAANAYNRIIESAGKPGFTSEPNQITGVKVRLANSQRLQGNYEGAEETMFAVLKELPKALDAQFEAAKIYEDWGDSSADQAVEKYLIAIGGREEPVNVWGYNRLAQRLRSAVSQDPQNEEFRSKRFEAQYRSADVFRKAAAEQNGDERNDSLFRAKQQISSLATMVNSFPDEEYERFNSLYRTVLGDLGEEVTDLVVGEGSQNIAAADPATDDTSTETGTAPTAQAPEAEPEGPEVNFIPIIAVALLALLAGGGIYAMQNAQKKKRRARFEAMKSKSKPTKSRSPKPTPKSKT